MDIVRTNIGRIALSFTAHMMEGVVADDNGKVEVIVYWDDDAGEYVMTPKWNRVKEVVQTFNLTNPLTVELDSEEIEFLKEEWGLVRAIRHLKNRTPGLDLKTAKNICENFRSVNMYWDLNLREYCLAGD
jgi:hypothetical protein